MLYRDGRGAYAPHLSCLYIQGKPLDTVGQLHTAFGYISRTHETEMNSAFSHRMLDAVNLFCCVHTGRVPWFQWKDSGTEMALRPL